MKESSPSYDSDNTVEDIDKIADTNTINIYAFERIIESCRKCPTIVVSVGEILDCLIRDIKAREAFTMKHNSGGQSDAARIKVQATSKSSEEEASISTKLPKQPDAKIKLSCVGTTEKGTSGTHSPPRTSPRSDLSREAR